ncbi:MAG: hypothetical protein U9N05_04345 [Euryarchaeota archaeon]|nr:hypothetical protein [Euryarchaeota archaeon]
MIPIARPQVGDPEIENVARVLRSGMLAGGRFGRAVLDGGIDADGAVFDVPERMFEHIAKEINLLS